MGTLTINIDMDKKCAECGKGGAVGNQLCLQCTSKAMHGKKMKSWQGAAVAKRFYDTKQEFRKAR